METESQNSSNKNHRELANDLSEIEWRVSQRLFPGARARFFQLRRALEQHLAAEERSLTSPPPSTNVALRRLVRKAADAIDARDVQSFSLVASDLHEALWIHARQVKAASSEVSNWGVETAKPQPQN